MISSLIYLILATLGLGFLVFIHELGHYVAARRRGMRVEVFSIGLGKPIIYWHMQGVKWQLCWLFFGGYVKIAGMEKEGDKEAHEIKDGFFGASPVSRIIVAVAGPLVNIVFALLMFTLIWTLGGRDKAFAEQTRHVGWIDPQSELYELGVRSGDVITAYDGIPVDNVKDHILAPMMAGETLTVEGFHYDFESGEKEPFSHVVHTYENPEIYRAGIRMAGVINSANFLIYDQVNDEVSDSLLESSAMRDSGMRFGDRIVWVDGERVFSLSQQSYLLNSNRLLLTVERDNETLLVRVPRATVGDLHLSREVKEELIDWKFETGLHDLKMQDLLFIPYNLTEDCVVQGRVNFFDSDLEKTYFPPVPMFDSDKELEQGDKILAVDGKIVDTSYQILRAAQEHFVNIIVHSGVSGLHKDVVSLDSAEADFTDVYISDELNSLITSIGVGSSLRENGEYRLLNSVKPLRRIDLIASQKEEAAYLVAVKEKKQEIEQISDAAERMSAYESLEKELNKLLLGIVVLDRRVNYNPTPLVQFADVFGEMKQTLSALFFGNLSPKWMVGPVGIVQMMQHQWMMGIVEALFWLGVISLNLGLLNLLPIPVLDGGYICMSIYEICLGKRVSSKAMERMVVPFAILLIMFFVFITYHDISRLITVLF